MTPSAHTVAGVWRRHRGWLIPLVAIPLTYLAGMLGSAAIAADSNASTNPGLILTVLGLWLLAALGPVVAGILTILGAVRTWTRWRRANGHLPAHERMAIDAATAHQRDAASAWDAARLLRAHLIAGRVPPTITVWEVVPLSGEVMFLDLRADYARYYGEDATYTHSSAMYFGHPLFVAAGLATNALGNAARRNAALARAQEQWREWQPSRVVVTNQRLVCLVSGRWLSFHYSAMTAVYPEISRWTLICQFPNVAPLLLAGHGTALMSVMTVMMTHGRGALAEHPSLIALEGSARRPGG